MRLRDEPVQIDSRHRSGEVKTLYPLTAELLETDKLLLSFDAFGRHFEIEGFGHGDYCGNERGVVRVGAESFDECAVHFHGIDWKELEVAQR